MDEDLQKISVAITTLGCKANQYDSSWMEALLIEHDFCIVDFSKKADVYIVNTCTVTNHADAESRYLIRQAHKRNPQAIKVVTGCYAQVRPKEVADIEGVHYVIGNDQKHHLIKYLKRARRSQSKIYVGDVFKQKSLQPFGVASYSHNIRAFVKVQDGCGQFCSYCIVPFARGRNRSAPISEVIDHLAELSEQGFQEAVLTGIHLGSYGHDQRPQKNIFHLLQAIETQKPIHRVRLSSIDPEEIHDEMIELITASKIICPHMHIPLQSGDDTILGKMGRRYKAKAFLDVCEKLTQANSDFCIGTDVMVGFPSESQQHFDRSYSLLRTAPIAYMHVFPFSAKEGTPAASMPHQVSYQQKVGWAKQLRSLSRARHLQFLKRFIGKKVEVILERRVQDPFEEGDDRVYYLGRSRNNCPVLLAYDQEQRGDLLELMIQTERGGFLVGKHVAKRKSRAQTL